eukprot:COSAG05_NODE_2051_length_3637_cov_5.084228_4_plen_525_part_00
MFSLVNWLVWLAAYASSSVALAAPPAGPVIFPAAGRSVRSYDAVFPTVPPQQEGAAVAAGGGVWTSLCVAHGAAGLASALSTIAASPLHCARGLVIMGASPLQQQQEEGEHLLRLARNTPMLIIAGDLDGVARFSKFAAARHRFVDSTRCRFAAIAGASHRSFASGGTPFAGDLTPTIAEATAHATIAMLVLDFVGVGSGDALARAEALASRLAAPIVRALQLEGSEALGATTQCDSDHPTNPKCRYPSYPSFSLPPGPKPAPSPLPPSNCLCGSPWVTRYAFPIVSGALDKNISVLTADAFHDVSDTHPFHLPHTFNACLKATASAGCVLNVTTVTMPLLEAGPLFPNSSGADPPLSALELRVKMKSRQTLWKAAGLGPQSVAVDQRNMTACRRANELAWGWALENAEVAVRRRFEAEGEPLVMVDDVEAPIGITGPEWIEKQLVFRRVLASGDGGDGDGDDGGDGLAAGRTHIEVQSWKFVVGDIPVHSKYLPTGMHYCKLLSPARAMEWIYLDSLRARIRQ